MKLSTKGRYATRAMLDLAIHLGEGPIQVKDISRRQEISERYLEQLFAPLKAAGLVRVVRGAHGGFALARMPSDIKLLEIIETMEGSISPVECVGNPDTCSRSRTCVTRDIWLELGMAMNEVLESTTLKDLVERQGQKEQHAEAMYHI